MTSTNEIITLVGHSRSVRCLHVDGTDEVRLVSGSNDRSIKVSASPRERKHRVLVTLPGVEHIHQSNMVEMCL